MIVNSLLAVIFAKIIKRGHLTVLCADGTKLRFGDDTGTPLCIKFHDAKAQWGVILDPDMTLGEIFTDARLTIEQGTLFEFLELFASQASNVKPPFFVRYLERARELLRVIIGRISRTQAAKNSHHHYDLDKGLYDFMLDSDKQYSCAYFETEDLTLEEAQLAKKRHIAAKLCLREEHNCLDIGSGWGGLARYFVKVANVTSVLGINLSQAHVTESRAMAEKLGLSERVTYDFQDYREIQGLFDRIVSVGQLEHVGAAHYATYFQKVADSLKPDGVALIHTIALEGEPDLTNPWITKYIFPQGYLPALSELVPAIEKAGLLVLDVEVWRYHYAKTLRAWHTRFTEHRAEIANIYDERFCRMWEFYLCIAQIAFLYENVVVYQLMLGKRLDAIPTTRDYIAVEKEKLKARENVLETMVQ